MPTMPPAELFRLTRELVDVESTTGGEGPVGAAIERRLQALAAGRGGVVERMAVGAAGAAGADRFNLFAAWGEPLVVLSTHMDTVPPFFPSAEDDEHIHGRG